MAWDEGSFLEGVIAGGISGVGAGVAAAPATAGTSVLIFGAIGAVLGALIKIRIFQSIFFVIALFLLSKLNVLPPYVIIGLIIVFFFWVIKGK